MSFLYIVRAIGLQFFYFLKSVCGINICNVLSAMVYDKVLRYPLLSEKKYDKSSILNLFQVDINRVKNILMSLYMVVSAII